jgi:hypothetical protein
MKVLMKKAPHIKNVFVTTETEAVFHNLTRSVQFVIFLLHDKHVNTLIVHCIFAIILILCNIIMLSTIAVTIQTSIFILQDLSAIPIFIPA